MSTFGALLKSERLNKRITQEELGKALGLSAKWISALENGKKWASYRNVLQFSEYFDAGEKSDLWFLEWLKSDLAREDKPLKEDATDGVHAIVELNPGVKNKALMKLEKLTRDLTKTHAPPTFKLRKTLDCLEAFDFGFFVCGDREDTPRTHMTTATFSSNSASITDLLYLHTLGLRPETRIVSHKIFETNSTEYLKERYGKKNLILVGSSLVNLAVRRVNDQALFQQKFHPALQEYLDLLARELKDNDDSDSLKVLHYLLSLHEDFPSSDKPFTEQSYVEKINTAIQQSAAKIDKWLGKSKTVKDFARRMELSEEVIRNLASTAKKLFPFSKKEELFHLGMTQEITDPFADGGKHVSESNKYRDLGLISIAPNPWSDPDDNYVAIICAGLKAPGTTAGLRFLSNPENFKGHPFGGVFEVVQNMNIDDFPVRFAEPTIKWKTQEYKPKDCVTALRKAAQRAAGADKEREEKLREAADFFELFVKRLNAESKG